MADVSQNISDATLRAFATESGMTKLLLMEATSQVSTLAAENARLSARVAELEQVVESQMSSTVADAERAKRPPAAR